MGTPISFAQGDHLTAEQDVVLWKVEFVDAVPPSVRLTASIQSDRNQPRGPSQVPTATSLELTMDARVALDLYRRIGEVAKKMGWPLPQ